MTSVLNLIIGRSILPSSAARVGLRTFTSRVSTMASTLSPVTFPVANAKPRHFSFSAASRLPAAAKATATKKKAAPKTKTKPKTKKASTTAVKKKKAKPTVTKKKPRVSAAAKKRALAAKKRKVGAKKKAAAKKKRDLLKKKITPANTPALKRPVGGTRAYVLFVKRLYPTLTPKPKTIIEASKVISKIWKGMSDLEKEPYVLEAKVLNQERRQTYNKWRGSLTRSQVMLINKRRNKHNKLGPPPRDPSTPRAPLTGYQKFFAEQRAAGQLEFDSPPPGIKQLAHASSVAAKKWKALTEAQRKAYGTA